MSNFQLNGQVVLFQHPEYGRRLLFKNGVVNPRDELGKHGVTIHHWFASFFYRTIPIQAILSDESGKEEHRVFYVNRNSLIKYLGAGDHATQSDEDLLLALKQKLWTENSDDQRNKQSQAGAHGLRHAGRHNQGFLNGLWTRLVNYLKASFLGWLYQKTIGGINRIKARFLFVGNEKSILEAGEVLAKERFREAYQTVPAYRTHIVCYNGQRVTERAFKFCDVQITSKENYIKAQAHDSDTHRDGKYPERSKTDTSTGTTGVPTKWVRSQWEMETVKKSLALAAQIQFGDRRLSYINAFALGPWATGLTTYELMRETGSVFAVGPDKAKILDQLVSIAEYETHQLELAVNGLQDQNATLTDEEKRLIRQLVQQTLKARLNQHDLPLKDELFKQFFEAGQVSQALMTRYRDKLLQMTERLDREKQQVIVAGYPPFLKDLADYARSQGHRFEDFSAVGVVGGQAISEAMRDQLIQHGFSHVYSSYGASDLDINLGVEGDDEILVRKAIESHPGLARELYGDHKGLPMVFHYDPMNYHVEVDDEDELIFTATRTDRSSPRVRYDLGDKGRVYASSDVQALLAKYGIFHKPKTNLPLMFVWGRDSTVVFNGANLAFTELERAVTNNNALEPIVLKKAFYTYEDASCQEKLEIWLELNEGEALPGEQDATEHTKVLLKTLASLNQDFRYQLEHLEAGTDLPVVRFFKRGESPISEADGHRKQVLIFQQGVNLSPDYKLPEADKAYGVTLKMSEEMRGPAISPNSGS